MNLTLEILDIHVGPIAWRLFKGDISFRTSSSSTNESNEELLRKFLKFFLDWGMLLYKQEPIIVNKVVENISNVFRVWNIFAFYS